MNKFYAIFCLPKKEDSGDLPRCDTLDFGKDGEPEPHLLARRYTIGLFSSVEEANYALKATCMDAQEKGREWIKKYVFSIRECVVRK
jgi:hypothetical protein